VKRFYGQWEYGFNLSWELDFWGRYRRAVEAADATLDASVENYDAVLVTLLGDVATNYVIIRRVEEQIKLAKANVDLQRKTLEIAQARFKGGTATELDVDQAQSNLSQTESEIPQFEVQLRQASNQLCILLGIPPLDLQTRLGTGAIPAAPVDVALGIPADLLRRRPDVVRAERLAAAQSAQIGIAEADFYPRISLTGTIGYSAEHFNNLFSQQAFQGTFGPSFTWNVLNYGRILNNVRSQDAQFQALSAAYQFAVLTANAEVENGLVAFLKSQERVKFLTVSVTASQKAVDIALAQYRGGTIDFNRLALLQQNLVQQQDLLAQAKGDIALGLIQVYRAMGGGWEIHGTNPEIQGAPIPKVEAPAAPGAPPKVEQPPAPAILLFNPAPITDNKSKAKKQD
jgi:NodT family efflux transporter outer membrane factor (OMF) lipoprotein